jgi:anti-sigma regulatory factor (Ser/Thr protein kinase)
VDWYLAADDRAASTALRHQIRGYLSRHCVEGSDLNAAELVAQELVANAVEHAAGPTWVRLSWLAAQPEIDVWDLGTGFALPSGSGRAAVPVEALDNSWTAAAPYPVLPEPTSPRGRGLFLVSHLATDFEVAARRGGGTHVAARLPVHRAVSPTADAPFLPADPLPDLAEVGSDGGFGKEAFLRALIVQLSQAVEYTAGPQVSESAVAQVGIAVGGQMEAAYRATQAIMGRLTAGQLADCYVRLKHAIDGQFRVEEITDDRIVLTNTRCPFGNAVRKAPALCRMTSSVFGGIAARNRDDGAAVLLEERIAVGDPGCRVIVYLGPTPAEAARYAHPYTSPHLGVTP